MTRLRNFLRGFGGAVWWALVGYIGLRTLETIIHSLSH
jgi:hypothetical protein